MVHSDNLTIRLPDDWHVHLRDGAMLTHILRYTERQFGRAIVMPNLNPPITTIAQAIAYRQRILSARAENSDFQPLMTCYLTDHAEPSEISEGFAQGVFTACKLYPAHATTNAQHGVSDVLKLYPLFATMEKIGMPLLLHGEVTDPSIDIFDREAVFIDRILSPLVAKFPALKIVFEHITTEEAVDFVAAGPANLAATITPHHLAINRNAMFQGGIRPHHYCLPVLKRERHRLALRRAATGGSAKFFLGTDSAPHSVTAKQAACGCAGIFNAAFALEHYAAIFDEENALANLEGFASENGPLFYGLPLNERRIVLERGAQSVPASLPAGDEAIIPFREGETLAWRFAGPA